MEIFDTHAHLDEEAFRTDLDEVVRSAAAQGVTRILTIGTTVDSSRLAIALAERYPAVHAAVGIHPNYAAAAHPDDWAILCELATHARVVAVGETGLDRHWDYSPINLQADYFDRHVALSREVHKPFIVHCRDAEEEVVRQLLRAASDGPLHGVMHSFCGAPETAAKCLEMGMHLSFSGMLTYKRNSDLRTLAATVPADRLFVETDCPYLAPAPHRGKRNEPAYTVHTARCLAEARGVTLDDLAAQTTLNALRFFGLASIEGV